MDQQVNEEKTIEFLKLLNIGYLQILNDYDIQGAKILHANLDEQKKVELVTTDGFMKFDCDAIDFTPLTHRICFIQDEELYLDINLHKILSIKFV